MKDSEFIELLNLYLDHEISAADAARLEAEVQSNPARRRVYQQYCRMQKACRMLTTDFQTEPVADTERKVVAFTPAAGETTRRGGVYAVGALAAAACLTVILIGRGGRQEGGLAVQQTGAQPIAREVAATIPTPTAASAQTAMAVDATPARRAQPMLVADSRLLTPDPQAQAMLTGAMQQANDQFEWLRTAQLAPLQQRVVADELRFNVRPASLRPESGRALGNRASAQSEPTDENIAFRFVK